MFSNSKFMNSTAAPRILLQKSYTELSFDEQNRVIIARWKGALTIEEVQEGCRCMTSFIREHGLLYHLSDHTELKALAPEVQEYLAGEWFYEVAREGLRKIAVRLAKDIFAQATVRRVNTMVSYGALQIEVFPSCEAAYEWLLQGESE